MSTSLSRQSLLDGLSAFVSTWAGRPQAGQQDLFAEQVELFSSHKGHASGREAVRAQLLGDFSGLDAIRIETTNVVPRAAAEQSLVGAYVHGQATASGQSVGFGGVLLLTFEQRSDQLRITTIHFQLNWVTGHTGLLAGWRIPPQERLWKPGDAPATLVTELDVPWHRIPVSDLATNDAEAITEAWYRYAWGIDQADFALFGQSFSEDVEAELTPMGRMKGRRTLVATLKAFRMPWPWMKHYGAPLQVDIAPDGGSAALVIGRIIPEQTHAPDGKPVYGAHYRIKAVLEADGQWRIRQMDYIPGWISTP